MMAIENEAGEAVGEKRSFGKFFADSLKKLSPWHDII
jgi:hypothetical protein